MMTEATIFIAAREKPTEAGRAVASRGGTVDKTCGAVGAMSRPQPQRVKWFVSLTKLKKSFQPVLRTTLSGVSN
jgi:hypothetical protein